MGGGSLNPPNPTSGYATVDRRLDVLSVFKCERWRPTYNTHQVGDVVEFHCEVVSSVLDFIVQLQHSINVLLKRVVSTYVISAQYTLRLTIIAYR